jgi:5,10-methylenetetrahydromethanopterin reductase
MLAIGQGAGDYRSLAGGFRLVEHGPHPDHSLKESAMAGRGLGIAVPIQHPLSVPECVELARCAEAVGYESLWIPEVVGADAFVLMTAMAGVTARLRLGTGIVPILTRTPSLLAMTMASLAQLAPGRVCLGLGICTPNIVQNWHGIAYDRPLARLRAYLAIVRRALAGERITFDNGLYPLRNFRLALTPPPQPVPIYVAALNPRMLQLAGELADGVLLNWIPEDRIGWALEHVGEGAKRAGRSLADVDVACLVRTCVTDDLAAARQWLRRELTGYAIVDAYQRYFRQIGFAPEVDAVNARWQAGDRTAAVGEISEAMTERLAVFGPASQCRARLARFAEAGVNRPIVFPFTAESDPLRGVHTTLAGLGAER